MDEKILIQSKQYSAKKLLWAFIIVGLIISIIILAVTLLGRLDYIDSFYEYDTYLAHNKGTSCPYRAYGGSCFDCYLIIHEYGSGFTKFDYIIQCLGYDETLLSLIPFVLLSLVGIIIYFWLRSSELTVTDKRIYGRISYGKRIDLPVDSVSATSTSRLFRAVSISTSSGRIKFRMIKNADAIYAVVSNLLLERQQKENRSSSAAYIQQSDEADQIKKYKDLLDSGVITQEEFDAKKKQLLGL